MGSDRSSGFYGFAMTFLASAFWCPFVNPLSLTNVELDSNLISID